MDRHWATAVIEELRLLDQEQTPHGLYGLREALRTTERLPQLPAVLMGPKVCFAKRIGAKNEAGRPRDEMISFELPGPHIVHLELRTYADTKIRRFGSTYRQDDSSRVEHEPPSLLRDLPKLAKSAKVNYVWKSVARSFGLLFIGHFRRTKDATALLDEAMSPAFLNRYGLTCVSDSWPDIYGRDFGTFLNLWYVDVLILS